MSPSKQHQPFTRRAVALLLLLTFASGVSLSPAVNAQQPRGQSGNPYEELADKVSPELRERMRRAGSGDDTVSVILQLKDRPTGRLNALLNRNGVRVRGDFEQLGAKAVDLPAGVVEELS